MADSFKDLKDIGDDDEHEDESQRLKPSEARRSWRLQPGCDGFEPNVFRPNICKKCAKKKELHGDSTPPHSPLAAEMKASIAYETEGGTYSSKYDDSDDKGGVDSEVAAAKSSSRESEGRGKGNKDEGDVKPDDKKGPPPILRTLSLTGAMNTPSKISPELKSELCDIVLRRNRRRKKNGEEVIEDDDLPLGPSPASSPKSQSSRSPSNRKRSTSTARDQTQTPPGSRSRSASLVRTNEDNSEPSRSSPRNNGGDNPVMEGPTDEHREEALKILSRASAKNLEPTNPVAVGSSPRRDNDRKKNTGPVSVLDPLPSGPQPTRLLVKRVRTVGVGSMLQPAKYTLYYQDQPTKSILVAEGQRSVDSKKLVDTTYSIFSGQMDKSSNLLGTVKRSSLVAQSGEEIYELSCQQPGSFNPHVLGLFHFITGFADNQNNPRQAHVFLAQKQDGMDVPPNTQQLYYGANVPGTSHLQTKEPVWNRQTNQHECLIQSGVQLEEGVEASIKTAQLVGVGRIVALQIYRPGADKDVFFLDTSSPFSLVQAFAFAIANIEGDIKGAKVLPTSNEPLRSAKDNRATQQSAPPATNSLFQTVIRAVRMDRSYEYKSNANPTSGSPPPFEEPDLYPQADRDFYTLQQQQPPRRSDQAGDEPALAPYIPEGIPKESAIIPTDAFTAYRRMWQDYMGSKLSPTTSRAFRGLLKSPPLGITDLWVVGCRAIRHCDPLVQLGLMSAVVAMIAELYPLSPTYNTMLAFASMYVMANIRALTSPFLLTYTFFVLVSIVLDINWLARISLMGFMENLKYLCASLVILNVILKFIICFKGLNVTPEGGQVLWFVWSYTKMCFPPFLGARKKALITEIYGRIIILNWMHFMGSLLYLVMFFVILGDFQMANEFDVGIGGAPLSGMIIMKTVSLLFVSGAFYRNIQTTPCLGMFGCLTCCYHWAMLKERRQRRKYGGQTPPVLIKGGWAKTIVLFKFLDLVVSGFMWATLILNYDMLLNQSPYSIQQMCYTIFGASVVLDVWAIILGISVAWLVSIYYYRKSLDAALAEDGADTATDQLVNGPGFITSRPWNGSQSSSVQDEAEGDDQHSNPMSDDESLLEEGAGRSDYYRQQQRARQDDRPTFVFMDYFPFTPEDFKDLWESLPSAVGFQCYVQTCPTIQEITDHLHGVSFFVIASGTTGTVMRTFACARGRMLEKGEMVKQVTFLMQVDLDASNNLMTANFKCEDSDHLGDFIRMLALGDLVGEYTVVV